MAVFLLLITGIIAANAKLKDGDVRLIDGRGYYDGRVEVFYNGTWRTVCDDYWDLTDAGVVCRQLGFPNAVAANRVAAFGRGQGQIWMDNVKCRGHESSLRECNHRGWGRHDCYHSEDAGVTCTPEVRLVGWGNLSSQGRVEVFYNGTWGIVFSSRWDLRSTRVVCRQLGFKGAVAAGFDSDRGVATRWFLNVRCLGSEISITKCHHTYSSLESNWGYRPSVVVVCITDPRDELSTEPWTTRASEITDPRDELSSNPQRTTSSGITVIILGVLFSISITAICFLIWKQRRYSQRVSRGQKARQEAETPLSGPRRPRQWRM